MSIVSGNSLKVLAVPAFDDNYLWLIHDGRHAAAVDPGDAGPILAALQQHQLSLTAILLTHHHADHIGGVPRLLQQFKVPVFGPRHEAITGVTDPLTEGDRITLPQLDVQLTVLEVPGHTSGHIAYFCDRSTLAVFAATHCLPAVAAGCLKARRPR
ncbi:MBL fold metallo-hydrolase [Undibacterium arcticum]